MTTITIRPVEGRRVRMPISSEIVIAETAVEDAPFWRRRIADGDLVLVRDTVKTLEAKSVASIKKDA